tara:strand:+ start:43 stop:594 length:552 start_codon:yes stop_codon:yes gene_type:complete
MQIEQSNVTKLKLTDLDRLDPVTVFIEDYEPGKGKITFECFGKSWSSYWGGMSGRGIAEFFLSCNTAYLVNCLWDHSQESTELDYDGLTSSIRKSVLELRKEEMLEAFTARELYNIHDWSDYAPDHCYDTWTCPDFVEEHEFDRLDLHDRDIPTKSTPDYCYLARIVEAISEAFSVINHGDSK